VEQTDLESPGSGFLHENVTHVPAAAKMFLGLPLALAAVPERYSSPCSRPSGPTTLVGHLVEEGIFAYWPLSQGSLSSSCFFSAGFFPLQGYCRVRLRDCLL